MKTQVNDKIFVNYFFDDIPPKEYFTYAEEAPIVYRKMDDKLNAYEVDTGNIINRCRFNNKKLILLELKNVAIFEYK